MKKLLTFEAISGCYQECLVVFVRKFVKNSQKRDKQYIMKSLAI